MVMGFGSAVGSSPNMSDQQQLEFEKQQQQDLISKAIADAQARYAQQQGQLKNVLDTYRQTSMQNLTTGQEGEDLRRQYNRLGLLNSGAFNTGLADKFSNIQRDSDMALMNQGLGATDQIQGIANQGLQTQSDLGVAGLQRQYGLEDQASQNSLARELARQRSRGDTTNALIGAGGGILGSLLSKGGGGGGFLGGLFGGGGGAAGGVSSSSSLNLIPGGLGSTLGGGGAASGGVGAGMMGLGALGYGANVALSSGLGQLLGKSIYSSDKARTAARRGAQIGSMVLPGLGGVLGGTLGGLTQSHAASEISKAVKNPGKTVSSTVKKIFCFLPETPIVMADGSEKPIGEISLKEEIKGGTVVSVRRALTDELCDYKGVKVSAYHAVLDGDEWRRIKDTELSISIPGSYVVVSLVTSGHRIYSKGIEFADEHETNDYEYLDLNESIAVLNLQREGIYDRSTSSI